MVKHCELAAELLRQSAEFIRGAASASPEASTELNDFAETCDNVATLVENDPEGEIE